MHGNGDAFLTTILQGFLLFCFLNKNNYQLPLPSWQGPWGLENPGLPQKVDLPHLECAGRPPLSGRGVDIACPSPRHGLFTAARMGLKGGLVCFGSLNYKM